jgi:CHAT domain-containing protein
VVFVITNTAIQQVVVPVDGKRLRRDLLRLRRALGSPATTPEAEQLIASVSAPLVTSIEPHLAGLSHLIVIAAGAMNYVPFQVLRLEDGRQIVDAFAVSNLPSASTIPLLHATAIDGRSVFVGALGTVAVPGWSPLPGTAREAEAVATFYPGARTAIGTDFTSSRVLGALRQDDLVHLATHGDLDDQSPLFSAVITSPAAGESARVALFQLMDTPVKSELVVLSACQTATGKLLGGDEVTGLTRTLLLAGANAVVSTLWNIDDEVTAMLMRAFHRELKGGKSAADALRVASLELRKTHPDPAHWAPFVVTAMK